MEDVIEVNDYKRWKIEAEEKFSSDDEAREYIKIAQLTEGDASIPERAMDSIIRKNIPLLSMYARQYSRRGSNFEDLLSEGMIAIIKAVRNFNVENHDVTVGTALITAIRTAMRRYVGEDRNIRIAVNASENKSKIHAVLERLKAEGKEVTIPMLASECRMSIAKIKKLVTIDLGVVSMNIKAEGKEGEGDEFGDSIIAESKTPDEELEEKEQRTLLLNIIENLDDVERTIIEYRYGLNGKEVKTLMEIAKIVGYTGERVRQIENRAISRMKMLLN